MFDIETWNSKDQNELFKTLLNRIKIEKKFSERSIQDVKKLMRYAYYLKMSNQKDYRLAEQEFERILRLYKVNAEACYRYAFILYQKMEWAKAIYYFDQALEYGTTRAVFPLTDSQAAKAPFFKGYCAAQILKEVKEELDTLHEEDKEFPAEGISVNDLIEQFRDEIKNHKYTLETFKGELIYLDDEAYEDIAFETKYEMLLNYADQSLYVKFQGERIDLSFAEMDLLERLIKAEGRIVGLHDLDEEITWDNYRTRINRLKAKFKRISIDLPIKNVRGDGGYQLLPMSYGIIRADA